MVAPDSVYDAFDLFSAAAARAKASNASSSIFSSQAGRLRPDIAIKAGIEQSGRIIERSALFERLASPVAKLIGPGINRSDAPVVKYFHAVLPFRWFSTGFLAIAARPASIRHTGFPR
jgi:hypothetical protein